MRLERTATGIRLILGTTVREVGIPPGAHVAITRQGSNWSIWVNGSLADSFSSNYRIPRKPATIGPVDTVLDEIRLTLAALYTAAFTHPAVPHQAWYRGNPPFTKGRITQGLQPIEEQIEGQVAGSEGSITEGSVPPNGQVAGSKGSITEGSVPPNGQVAGSEGSITEGSVLPNAQVRGSKGSITEGSVLPNAQVRGSKGQILQGESVSSEATIPGQNAGAKGFVTDGRVITFGIYPGQSQFAKGFILQGKRLILGDRWLKGFILQGTTPSRPPLSLPPRGTPPGQQQYAKRIPSVTTKDQKTTSRTARFSQKKEVQAQGIPSADTKSQTTTNWTARFLQKEEGQVVPAISLGGDLAVTLEGQQFRGRLLPRQEPEPGTPLLVTGSPGNYLLDTLSWDPAGSSVSSSVSSSTPSSGYPAFSPSTYSPVVLDSQRGQRCGLCVTLDELFPFGIRQRWGSFASTFGGVKLAQRVPEGVRSVKVDGLHFLFLGIYSRESCLRRDRRTGFWAKGRFNVPFPTPIEAKVFMDIQLDGDNRWLSQSFYQSDTDMFNIPVAEDGRWQFTWQDNPRQAPGRIIEIPGSSDSIDVGVFRLAFQFPFDADLATLVELEMCFGKAALRRINE